MKTVWNVISEVEIMDHPTVQSFTNEKDALICVQEIYAEYCFEHEIDAGESANLKQENIAGSTLFILSGGRWDEWVYVTETEITPPTVGAAILLTDKDI